MWYNKILSHRTKEKAMFDGYTGWQTAQIVFSVLSFLFVIGSTCGWLLEVLFRRFVSAKKWINPGFLTGPCLPIYGFGVASLFCLCLLRYCNPIPETVNNYSLLWDLTIILLIGVAMTLIELIAGLIFIKGMKIRLWDYSKRPGNIAGLICPLFSFIWTVCGALFLYFLFPLLTQTVEWFLHNTFFLFFVGVYFGVMAVDFAHSMDLANKLKRFAKENKTVIRFEQLKESIAAQLKEKNLKRRFMLPFRSPIALKEHLTAFLAEEKQKFAQAKRKRHKKSDEIKTDDSGK